MLFRLHTSLAAAALATLGAAALAGCGQKGPLVLPPGTAASAPPSVGAKPPAAAPSPAQPTAAAASAGAR